MGAPFFCKFQNEHGDIVYINPLRVNYVTYSQTDRNMSAIIFESGHSLIVNISPGKVHEGMCTYHRGQEFSGLIC